MNRRTLIRAIAPVLLMGVIFYLSAQSSTAHYPWWEVVLRKLGHVTGYALLTALWAWALQGAVRRPIAWALGISLAYACTDEFHQTFVHGRTGTPVDVAIDAIGMTIAALLMSRMLRAPRPAPGY
jgi:VanZ family protein